MTTPSFDLSFIFYVADPARSSRFYEKLLGRPASASFPNYAAFQFENGLILGLWSTGAKDFVSAGTGHRSELAFVVEDAAVVDTMYEAWQAMGVPIEQEPMNAVFGRTFVALDPDGHRLRVCTPD